MYISGQDLESNEFTMHRGKISQKIHLNKSKGINFKFLLIGYTGHSSQRQIILLQKFGLRPQCFSPISLKDIILVGSTRKLKLQSSPISLQCQVNYLLHRELEQMEAKVNSQVLVEGLELVILLGFFQGWDGANHQKFQGYQGLH